MGKWWKDKEGVIFIAKINFIAALTNPLPPWNHTQIKKNDWECSSLFVVFQYSFAFSAAQC